MSASSKGLNRFGGALAAALVATIGVVLVHVQMKHPPLQPERYIGRESDGHYVNDRDLLPVNGKGGSDIVGPYEPVKDWPIPLHSDWRTGATGAVHAESPDRIFVHSRGEFPRDYAGPFAWGPNALKDYVPIYGEDVGKHGRWEHVTLIYDRHGKLVESWDQWDSILTNRQRVLVNPYDPERHIWMTGGGVLVFTRDGKRLVASSMRNCNPAMTTCIKDVPVNHLDWMPNGDFYGSTNTTVLKYTKDWKKVMEFGKQGSGPGEFRGIHGVVVDPDRGRLYISDRANSRIQVFDLQGKFLEQWPNILGPFVIRLSKDGRYLWVADGYTNKFLKFDAMTGRLLTSFGTLGTAPGAFWGIHDFDTDSEGNLYMADDFGARAQKLVPRKDGNPDQLIGPLKPGGR